MKSISDLKVFYLVKKLLAKRTEDLAAINKRIDEHTHKYAGSDSIGGPATSANKLSTARTLKVDLSLSPSNADTFDGSSDSTIGVEGTLPVSLGGTGVNDIGRLADNMGMPRMYVNTYTGTGEGTRKFTFDFTPEFVYVSNLSCGDTHRIYVRGNTEYHHSSNTASNQYDIALEWGDDYFKHVDDSYNADGSNMYNKADTQYVIFAIGRAITTLG
jgi:hypothetical protein